MKKMFVNFKSLGFVALAAAALTFSSCTKEETIKCAEARDDNFESTTLECDEVATVAKFIGNWKMNISEGTGTYDLEISQSSTDYNVTIKSNFGLTVNGTLISPITEVFSVSQNKATFAGELTSSETSSKITDFVLTVNGSDATITGKFDGNNFTDSGSRL